jgi:hypothetical protein
MTLNLRLRLFAGCLAFASAVTLSSPAAGQAASGDSGGGALQARHAELKEQLARSPYGRPLVLESSEAADTVDGNVYAVLASPHAAVSGTFKSPARWCDVMILHLNTKYCRASSETAPGKLKVHIGKKTAQQLGDAFELDFDLKVLSASPGYLAVAATSPKGPLGTTNYRIEIQAIPLDESRTFLHLRYSYGYGAASRIAMRGYLATLGSGKVGFTESSKGGERRLVDGMRGAVERNTMRYYLAVEAFQAALSRPAAEQQNARLNKWFDSTEEYPRQLREIRKADYLTMKGAEIARQQSSPLVQ